MASKLVVDLAAVFTRAYACVRFARRIELRAIVVLCCARRSRVSRDPVGRSLGTYSPERVYDRKLME